MRSTDGRSPRHARRARSTASGSERYSFTLAFKGVFLEGLEVVFIVLAFGSAHHGGIAIASAAAATLALIVVVTAGVILRTPLSRVPENALKFAVGTLLTIFGIFWSAEGAGISWPGDETALFEPPGRVIMVGERARGRERGDDTRAMRQSSSTMKSRQKRTMRPSLLITRQQPVRPAGRWRWRARAGARGRYRRN
jgi:hypothetical protein